MADVKHVHFTLNPNNTRDNKIIKMMEQLPERQKKNFFMNLLESRSDMVLIAQEVHALVVHFGVSVVTGTSDAEPVQQNRQLDGQIGVEDFISETPKQDVEDSESENIENPDDEELPEGVMDFISGMSDWGGQ